jgi:hypothetical protein
VHETNCSSVVKTKQKLTNAKPDMAIAILEYVVSCAEFRKVCHIRNNFKKYEN